jgi:hypothetical protein
MSGIRLGSVSYNDRLGAFQARVDIERNGTTFRYPCQISGPETMDIELVRMGLTQQALRMSDSVTFH